jgi:hypothetical protein
MHPRYITMAVLAAFALSLAIPAAASATDYKVRTKGGRVVGVVRPGAKPEGADRIGTIRDRDSYRGAVYSRQNSSGYWGWPVANTSKYVAWVRRASAKRFFVKKLPWSRAVGRAVQISSGTWLAQKKVNGKWRTIGRVQKGCKGRWAAGAARLLLWSR